MDYLEGFVTTIGHVAWPGTAIGIAVIARKELKGVITALAKRIEDKNSAVSITKEGFEIKAVVEAQEARLVSLQAEQDQVKSLAMRQFKPKSEQELQLLKASEQREIDKHLRQLADNYLNIKLSDHKERTRAKNIAAEEMAFYVVSNRISKDWLAREKHEGILIALAESILLSSEMGDADRLLKAAVGAQRLHVRYRVLIAFTKLIEKNLLSLHQLNAVKDLLKEYEQGADNPLMRLISSVRSLVNEIAKEQNLQYNLI